MRDRSFPLCVSYMISDVSDKYGISFRFFQQALLKIKRLFIGRKYPKRRQAYSYKYERANDLFCYTLSYIYYNL
ncbi:hypothetical protein BEQ56_04995 [Anaerolineaceae bacterium oral taxon 439]|nr:hypothetical protein BEQ56_04995 [Anaerolineaceae bacterium oral taxon 439]